MLVEGERAPQNDLDSCRGHLLVGSPINYDFDSFRGNLLIGAKFFSLVKLLACDLVSFYVGSRITMIVPY